MLREILRGAALAVAAAMLLFGTPARAGVDDGIAAFHDADYVTAFAELEAARAGDPVNPPVERPPSPATPKARAAAEYYLARMYLEGRGVGTEPELGLALLRRAAHQEYPAALVAMSERYRTGDGVMPNRREAQRMIRRAIALGDPEAVTLWARHYAENPVPDLADLRQSGEIPGYFASQPAPEGPDSRILPRDPRLVTPLPVRGADDLITDTGRCPTSACSRTVN